MAYDQNGAAGPMSAQGFGAGIAFDDAPRPLGETTYDPTTGVTRTYDPETGETRAYHPLTGQTQTYDPATGRLTAFDSLTGEITITTHDPETGVTTTVNPVTGASRTYDPLSGQSTTVDGVSGQTTVYDTITGDTTTYDPETGETVTYNPLIGATTTHDQSVDVSTHMMQAEMGVDSIDHSQAAESGIRTDDNTIDDMVTNIDQATGLVTALDPITGAATVYDPVTDETTYYEPTAGETVAYDYGVDQTPLPSQDPTNGTEVSSVGAPQEIYDYGTDSDGGESTEIDEPLAVDWSDTTFEWQDDAADTSGVQATGLADSGYHNGEVGQDQFDAAEDEWNVEPFEDAENPLWPESVDTAYEMDDFAVADSGDIFDPSV